MVSSKIKVSGAVAPSTDEDKKIVTRYAFMTTLGVSDEMMGDDTTLEAYHEFNTMYQKSHWTTFETVNDSRLIAVSGFGRVEITGQTINTGFFTDAFLVDKLGQVINIAPNKENTIEFNLKSK